MTLNRVKVFGVVIFGWFMILFYDPIPETKLDDILFLIFTSSQTKQRIHHMLNTWLRHVPEEDFVIYSDFNDSSIPNLVYLGEDEDGRNMTKKVPKGFIYAYEQFPSKKWYYKIDDDTFVVVRNLLRTLNRYDYRKIQYIGHRKKLNGFVDCNGGAGYILSRRLLDFYMPYYPTCAINECDRGAEDQCMAECIRKYFGGRQCTDDKGFNMGPEDIPYRTVDCMNECVSIHGAKGALVDQFYYQLYIYWEKTRSLKSEPEA